MNITEERLVQIQARLNAVEYPDHEHLTICGREGTKVVWVEQSSVDGSVMAGGSVAEVDAGPRTAQMFLNAPQDLADLITEIHRLRAELAKVREVTDDMIERAAVQMCASGRNESIWKNTLYEDERESFRKDARAVLAAALGGDDA